jgi:hypothetical protein
MRVSRKETLRGFTQRTQRELTQRGAEGVHAENAKKAHAKSAEGILVQFMIALFACISFAVFARESE